MNSEVKESTFPERPYVLVVESDPDEMYRISEGLKKGDFRVVGVMGKDGFSKVTAREMPDAIILDMHLSEGDARRILELVGRDGRMSGVKVITMTLGEDEERLLDTGADLVIKKPVQVGELAETVEKILSRR